MVVPSLALAGGALLFFGVPQVRREMPLEAEAAATAASRPTVGAASLAAPHRSSDADDELTPVFDIARIDPTGDAVIAGRAAPNVSVELLRNGYVHDRAVAPWGLRADKSGDTVTFQAPRGGSTILPNGVKFSVLCEDKKLVFKRTGAPDLTFDCST
jgi:hypothetical protein